MIGGMKRVIAAAASINQLKKATCEALPTCVEEINNTICAGITMGNNAADCAFRANHKTFRISCPPNESRVTFTDCTILYIDTSVFMHPFAVPSLYTTRACQRIGFCDTAPILSRKYNPFDLTSQQARRAIFLDSTTIIDVQVLVLFNSFFHV